MNLAKVAVSIFIGGLFLASAHADDVRVAVPKISELGEQTINAETAGYIEPEARKNWFELNVSTWTPKNFTLDSRISQTTPFTTGALPYFSATLITTAITAGDWGSLKGRGGLGVLTLIRSGYLPATAVSSHQEQSAYLFPIEAGVEARPSILQWRSLSFYGDASLLPSVVLTERSAFDDGRSLFGVGGRFSIGADYSLGHWMSGAPIFLNLDVLTTVGTVDEASLTGTGVQAGLRVAI